LQNGGHWICFDLKTTYNLIADRIEVFIFKSHKINAETHLSPPPKKNIFGLNLKQQCDQNVERPTFELTNVVLVN
jgi:hypothetical protein